MRTLVAHEWIGAVGGSENVFEQIRLTVPGARAVCLWNDDPARFTGVEETWLARSPVRGRKVAAMPLMGSAWRRVDLGGVDRVIASSHAFCHHLAGRAAARGIPSFAYVHSPARYVWAPDLDSRGNTLAGRLGRSYFRHWDRRHVNGDVHFAANSAFVADRIAAAWGVPAEVIHPPVDVDRVRAGGVVRSAAEQTVLNSLPAEFVLGASRLVRYKNVDAAIAAGEILDLPVVLVGEGPDGPRLRARAADARVPVTFTGRVSDDLLVQLYRRAALFVYMPIEDFGIMPVEAMACGTPVLVNELGGARESVCATGGGRTATWRDGAFADPAVVRAALATGGADASAVAGFSAAAFRRKLTGWLLSAS